MDEWVLRHPWQLFFLCSSAFFAHYKYLKDYLQHIGLLGVIGLIIAILGVVGLIVVKEGRLLLP